MSSRLERFSPLAGINLAERTGVRPSEASSLCFSPLAGINLAESTLPRRKYYVLKRFSPLAGINLAESSSPLPSDAWLAGFQSPCGD